MSLGRILSPVSWNRSCRRICLLAEHRELREALGLSVVSNDTTLYRFLRRLTEEDILKRHKALKLPTSFHD